MSRTLHVIVVDDEPKIRRGIAKLVEEHSSCWLVLGVFSNGKEALEYIRTTSEPIDLLITDVKMPEMDGLTLIQEAKVYKSFQALVVSGYDDFVYVRSALKEGVMDYIIKPIDRQTFRYQLSEIKNKLEKRQYESQVEHLKRLFAGEHDTIAQMNHEIFQEGTYRLCCISIDDPPHRMKSYSEQSWGLVYYSVQNIVDEWIANHTNDAMSRGWSWQENKGHTWILLRKVEEVEQLAEQIRVSITKFLGMTVTIAIGAEFDDISYLSEFRNEVLTLLYFRLISGGNKVYMKDHILASSSLDITEKLHQIGERIRIAMLQEDEEKTHSLLSECFEELKEIQEPSALEQAIQYCLLQMMSILSEIDHQKAKLWLTKELNDLHFHLSSFPSLQKRLLALFLHISSYIRNKRDKTEVSPVDQAKEWIQQNLSGPVTIQMVAEHVHMNPTYFCELFKLQTGETVHEYLTRKRMETAAKLVLNAQLKLMEIAQKVGYKDVKYFSRQFKKHYGILPSKYKELYS